jgi:hypothetical protein
LPEMLFTTWGAYRRALVSGHNADGAQVLGNQGDLHRGIEQTVQTSQFSARSSGRNRGLDRLAGGGSYGRPSRYALRSICCHISVKGECSDKLKGSFIFMHSQTLMVAAQIYVSILPC